MGLTYSDNSPIADLSVKSITGRAGMGFYRLLFEVSITQHTIPSKKTWGSFREICGQLRVGPPGGAHNDLGRIVPEVPLVVFAREASTNMPASYSYSHLFYIDLNQLQIERIEGLRNGGDLEFVLQISGISDGFIGPHGSHEWVHFNANQIHWIKVLKEMNYQEFLLFEIPIPPENASGELKQAVKYMSSAKDYLLKGHYDKAVGECRLVLDGLTQGLKDEPELKTAIDLYRRSKTEMNIDQRFLFLREATRHVCHPPHHVSDELDEVLPTLYDRADAICVLGVTAAILARSLRIG